MPICSDVCALASVGAMPVQGPQLLKGEAHDLSSSSVSYLACDRYSCVAFRSACLQSRCILVDGQPYTITTSASRDGVVHVDVTEIYFLFPTKLPFHLKRSNIVHHVSTKPSALSYWSTSRLRPFQMCTTHIAHSFYEDLALA